MQSVYTILLLIVSNIFMTCAWYGHFGFRDNGGPFNLIQLKVIQEVITLVVFVAFSTIAFKGESFKWNHALAFVFLVAAVYLVFKK